MKVLFMLQRWRIIACILGLGIASPVHAFECTDLWQWLNFGCRKVADTYEKGHNGILLSGFSWHIPYTWTPEKRAEENENAWGGGWSRTVEHPNGDTDIVYFMVFQDSHKEAQFNLGYAWATYWGPRKYPQPGLGFTAAIIQRPDIASGVPVPVILPMFNLRWGQATLMTTYIPNFGGGVNNGSVLYVFGQIEFP